MNCRIFKVFVNILVLLAIAYAADFAALHYRITKNHNPYGTVLVRSYYAISKKANKVEYDFAGTESVTCAHSIFPQHGYVPGWYASKHIEK